MSKNILAAFSILCVLMPVELLAKEQGLYLSAGAGPNFRSDSGLSGAGTSPHIDFEDGFAGSIALGYKIGNGLRSEIETMYLTSDVDTIAGSSMPSGKAESVNLMLNVLYDFNINSKFTPYVGVGAGVSFVGFDGISPINGTSLSNSDEVPVAQGIVGISYDITDSLEFFGTYRYMNSIGNSVDLHAVNGSRLEGDYENNIVMFGLTYNFGAPKRAPIVEAKVEKKPIRVVQESDEIFHRSYVTFFNFGSFNLTPESKDIVRNLLTEAQSGKSVSFELTGHADRVGSDAQNMILSKNRALAIRDELISLGAHGDNVTVSWKGESEPLVPTKDGIAEPQNRRTEIRAIITTPVYR